MKNLSDFQKITLAFSFGTGSVLLGLAIHTGFQLEAIALTTLGPVLVYATWAFFELRQLKAARMRDALNLVVIQRKMQAQKVAKEKLAVLFGESRNDNPLAYIATAHRGERRVLLPRDHEITKQRILKGRGEYLEPGDEVNNHDQWHD